MMMLLGEKVYSEGVISDQFRCLRRSSDAIIWSVQWPSGAGLIENTLEHVLICD